MLSRLGQTIQVIVFAAVLNLFVFGSAKAFSAGELIDSANASRTQNGFASLTANSQLEQAAISKANDILANDYFAHTSPAGKTPWDFIKGAGYNYTFAGENLAIGYSNTSELHNDWMNSASHRANILNQNFTEVGIAIVSGEYKGSTTIVVVQMFGRPYHQPAVSQPESQDQKDLPAVASASDEQNQVTASFVTDQSLINPAKVFTEEEVSFTVAYRGEVDQVFIEFGGEKFDLLSNSQIKEENGIKILEKKLKVNQEGDLTVKATLVDKNGQKIAAELGILRILPKTISNPAADQNPSNFWNQYFGLILTLGVILVLGSIGFLTWRWSKINKLKLV